jgi:hypothetical protein
MVHGMDNFEIAVAFEQVLDSSTLHFFVGIDEFDLEAVNKIIGFDYDDSNPQSIIQFLQLPTVTARVNTKRKDLIVDYTKAIVLSSPQYVEVTVHVKTYKENTTKEREE